MYKTINNSQIPDDKLSFEELTAKYEYLLEIADRFLFVSYEEFMYISSDANIKIGDEFISPNFLKKLLSDDRYYIYAKKYFSGEISSFFVTFVTDGNITKSIGHSKSAIIQAIEQAITYKKITLTDNEKRRFQKLRSFILEEKMVQKYEKELLPIEIDGQGFVIAGKQLIALMQMPQDEFAKLCTNDYITTINRIPKAYFIYAALNFFEVNDIRQNYLLSPQIIQRIADIKNNKYIDLQALNKHNQTTDTTYKDIKLNPSLVDAINYAMPEDLTPLEKACYIYIKMCMILVYNSEYLASRNNSVSAQKHKDKHYLETITPENNEVVCFEFNLIYAMLLGTLGINLRTNYSNSLGENYGETHANLEFRYDKFIVRSDAMTSVLQGDLFRVKMGLPIIGLKCVNTNEETRKEFEETLQNMYNLVSIQEMAVRYADQKPIYVNFKEAALEYAKVTKNRKDIPLKEKLEDLFFEVNSSGLSGVDCFSYIQSIMLTIFSGKERANNISFTLLSNYDPSDHTKEAMPCGVFALNNYGLDESDEPNTYYLYEPEKQLVSISKDDLQAKFDNGKFVYIDDFRGIIQGIHGGAR